jgi:hypothetical protein
MATTEDFLGFQVEALEMIAAGRPLLTILDAIARHAESQSEGFAPPLNRNYPRCITAPSTAFRFIPTSDLVAWLRIRKRR